MGCQLVRRVSAQAASIAELRVPCRTDLSSSGSMNASSVFVSSQLSKPYEKAQPELLFDTGGLRKCNTVCSCHSGPLIVHLSGTGCGTKASNCAAAACQAASAAHAQRG